MVFHRGKVVQLCVDFDLPTVAPADFNLLRLQYVVADVCRNGLDFRLVLST